MLAEVGLMVVEVAQAVAGAFHAVAAAFLADVRQVVFLHHAVLVARRALSRLQEVIIVSDRQELIAIHRQEQMLLAAQATVAVNTPG